MSEEYEKLENDKDKCNCQQEGEQNCTCGDDCHCNEENTAEKACDCGCTDENCTCYEYIEDEGCKRVEKLLMGTLVVNIIIAIFVAVIAFILLFKIVVPSPQMIGAVQQPQEAKPIFKDESISLEDAMQQDKYLAVLFYADWCPHCRRFAPTYNKLSKNRKLGNTYNFVRINSEDPAARVYMEEFKVEGFPSFFLVNPKTNEKHLINNNLLFGDGAKEVLVDIMDGFADKR